MSERQPDVMNSFRERLDDELQHIVLADDVQNKIVAFALGKTGPIAPPEQLRSAPGPSPLLALFRTIGRWLDTEIVVTGPQLSVAVGVLLLGLGLHWQHIQQRLITDEAELSMYRDVLEALRDTVYMHTF